MMNWLTKIFGTSDYLERDPYRKLVVGLAHFAIATIFIECKVSMELTLLVYILKEVLFDLARVFVADRSKWAHHIWADRWLVADSVIDCGFWYLGAAMALHSNPWYGVAAVVVGLAYFVAGKLRDVE